MDPLTTAVVAAKEASMASMASQVSKASFCFKTETRQDNNMTRHQWRQKIMQL